MKNIGLFFGAGGSVIYEKPTTLEFRKILTFNEDPKYMFYNKKSIHQIINEFLPEGDIEDVLEALKNIFDFNESLGNKLFNLSFPQFYRFNGAGAPVVTSRLVLEEADYRTSSAENYTTTEPIFENTINKFKDIQQHIYKQIFRKYEWKNKHDDILNSIMRNMFLKLSEHKIFVATTNYDQAFDKYFNNSNLTVVDGFERDGNSRRFIWKGNFKKSKLDEHIAYYKLHGSLNWRKTEDGNIMSTDIEDFGNDYDKDVNCLIYPTISPKDGALNEPFKTIFENFKESLKNSDIIIIVGFSFRDLEITKLFKEFHESGGKIAIIDIKTPMFFLEQLGIEEHFKEMHEVTSAEPWSAQLIENVLFMKTEFSEKTLNVIFDQISESFLDEPPLLDALDK